MAAKAIINCEQCTHFRKAWDFTRSCDLKKKILETADFPKWCPWPDVNILSPAPKDQGESKNRTHVKAKTTECDKCDGMMVGVWLHAEDCPSAPTKEGGRP